MSCRLGPLFVVVAACQYGRPNDVPAVDAPPGTCADVGPNLTDCPASSPVCSAAHVCTACGTDNDCEGRPASPVCVGEPAGVCVACDGVDAQSPALGTGADPCPQAVAQVCDSVSHECRACRGDAECVSGVCEGGSCIDPSRVVYVRYGEADNGVCTQSTPCGTPGAAMAVIGGARRYLKLSPNPSAYFVEPALSIATDVSIHADGAILERPAGGQVVNVTAATVRIEGLSVRDAVGSAVADGIKCTGADLTLVGVTISGCSDHGLEAGDCVLDVDRAEIARNGVGGVRAVGGNFSIRNSFVYANGSATSGGGGLTLNPSTTPNVLEFNTIVKNAAANNATSAGGVLCASGSASIVARNNVIYGSVNSLETVGPSCTHSYSVVGASNPPAGMMVQAMTAGEVGFVNLGGTTAADFHLAATSQLRGAGDPALGAELIDFDGDARPNPAGSRADIGADEVP